jgi:Mg-chelatase subunit ChlD
MLGGMLLQLPLGLVAPAVPVNALPVLPARTQLPVPQIVIGSTVVSTAVTPSLERASNTDLERASGTPPLYERLATCVCLVISMLMFIRMAFGSWRLRQVLRDARPVSDLGSEVYESVLFVAPGSVGWFRPKVILPQAWRRWDPPKLRAVLAHERAHIRRRDCLIRLTSHVNVCIFWFHPLAWWIERELARLAEEACDDVAVSEIKDGDEYAAALVAVARAVAGAAAGGVFNRRIISMARESNVGRRVNRILDRGIQMPKPFGRLGWATLFACGLPVIYLSAAVMPTAANGNAVLPRRAAVATPYANPASKPLSPGNHFSPRMMAQADPNPPLRPAPLAVPSKSEQVRVTMCILIDNSGSMRNKREAVKAAALGLVNASKPGDKVCVVNFNDEVYYDLPHGEDFTSDVAEMQEALTHIDSRGGSSLRDAVRISIDHLQQADRADRRVLVLVTDGGDNSSRVSQEQLVSELTNSGVRIYAIGLAGDDDPSAARRAQAALGQLARASGGRDYYPNDLAEVESISPQIADELGKR